MLEKEQRWSDEKMEQFYQEFKDHADYETALLAQLLKAFPDDDPVAHRQYHEAAMRAAEAQERFWSELRLDIAKKSFWGIITLICGIVLAGAAVKMGIKP